MKAKTKAPACAQPKPDSCKALLGGLLCGLVVGGADIKEVREAVQWWSRNSKAWVHFASFAAREKAARE